MIVHELDVNKGGMTTAMLTRSRIFHDYNIEGNIVTFDYKVNYKDILNKLIDSKKMDSRTNMLNPFSFYKSKSDNLRNSKNRTIYKEVIKLLKNTVEIKENNSISRYFNIKNGEYTAFKKKNGKKCYLDLFENNKRYKRIYYFDNKIHKVDIFNHENRLIAEQFFDEHCYLYLYRQVNAINGTIGKTYLINEQKEFKNNVEFCKYFLEEMVEDNQNQIMICDGPGSFPKMLDTCHKLAKKYAVIHINHHKNFDDSGAVKKKEDYILKNANNIDGVIVLTESQKIDIVKEYNINNVYVISNFINIPKKGSRVTYNKVVGHISRLVPQKGLTYLIDVAKEVVNKDSEVEFHIYGDGEEKDKLSSLIKKYNLESNVKLLGYTNNASQKIEKFGCVVSTSQFEGQGLSIIEAMLLETPVIAFDIKYGPSDFIRNNKNGYLIENKNISEMANKIIEILNDKNIAQEFGKVARNTIVYLYNREKLMKKWQDLFDN